MPWVKSMTCEFCGGETAIKQIKKQHWLNGKLYIVENVEAEICRECGEKFFHATTLDGIDRLLKGDHKVKESLEVEVVRF
jgi:YgiT-type zinc finger domain-containing protein